MQNVTHKVENGKLIVTVDLSKRLGLSSSALTELVASTGKAVRIGDTTVYFAMNCYDKTVRPEHKAAQEAAKAEQRKAAQQVACAHGVLPIEYPASSV